MMKIASLSFLLLLFFCNAGGANAGAGRQHRQSRQSRHHVARGRHLQSAEEVAVAVLRDDAEEVSVLWPQKPLGDEGCPCLLPTPENLELFGMTEIVDADAAAIANISGVNASSFYRHGFGCAPHDITSDKCQNMDDCTRLLPVPDDCDRSWCQRSWCYVDRNNCLLESSQSDLYFDTTRKQNFDFSYASCGHMNQFTHVDRIDQLQNRTIRVGFNSNSGGWMGSYNPQGSFAINNQWNGPLVDFITETAYRGNFTLVQTKPPDWLVNESKAFWGDSDFDLCVYAASLGYLDMCVADYTITPQRASVADFFEVNSNAIYLVTFLEKDSKSGWDKFKSQLVKIYQPLTLDAWMFIFFFCVPTLGLLMLFHEYGGPGTAFPKETEMQVIDPNTGRVKMEMRESPMIQHSVRAVFIFFLSCFVRGYRVRIFTVGGKFQLLAMTSFLILTTTVYTANLAAQFVTEAQRNEVDNLKEALEVDYHFCAERSIMATVSRLHNIDHSKFVVGGDGKPGFNCCGARRRAIDFMKQNHGDKSQYCDVALITHEDLEILQQNSLHCNKTIVGGEIASTYDGIALSSDVADEMTAHLYAMKYDGYLAEQYLNAKPEPACIAEGGERKNSGLDIEELTGIWVAVYAFALAGLIAKALQKYQEPYLKEHKVKWVDQWGNALPNPQAKPVEADNKEVDAKEVDKEEVEVAKGY